AQLVLADQEAPRVLLQLAYERLDGDVPLDEGALDRLFGPGGGVAPAVTSVPFRLLPPLEVDLVDRQVRVVLGLEAVVDVLGHVLDVAVRRALNGPRLADGQRPDVGWLLPPLLGGRGVGAADRGSQRRQDRQRA